MLNKFHLKYKSFETLYKSLYCHFGLIFCVFAELKNITDPKHWTIVYTVLKYALQINSQFLFESAQFSFAVGQLHSQSFRRFISKPTWRGYMGCRWFPFLTKLCYPLKIKKRHPKLKSTLSEHNCELIISSLTYLHLKSFSHLQVCVSLAEQVLDLFGHGAEESLQLGSIQPTHVSKLQRKHCAWSWVTWSRVDHGVICTLHKCALVWIYVRDMFKMHWPPVYKVQALFVYQYPSTESAEWTFLSFHTGDNES